MQAEIISIGDEITSGQSLDTNSQWLSQRLGEMGIPVLFHTTVGDDMPANVRVFREAADRADLVIATGGLGPTADDLTREAIAAAAGVELVFDEAVFAWLADLFRRRGREMPEQNRRQAYFPAGSRVVPNPDGTAPGIDFDFPRPDRAAARVIALPGVPAEMKQMWEQTVAAAVRPLGAGRIILHKKLKCFGAGESDLERMLPDLIRRGRYPRVGITVSGATITLRITAEEATAAACEAIMRPTIETIRGCLGDLVFGEDDEELQHAVVRLLRERRRTLATAEWGSGGLLAAWLSEVDGYRDVVRGGVAIATADAAGRFCQLPPGWFRGRDTTGPEVATELAQRCRDLFHADYGLGNADFPAADPADNQRRTGVPPVSPQRGTGVPPVALARCHFALAFASGVEVQSAPFAAHPELLKTRAAKQALNLLRLSLLR